MIQVSNSSFSVLRAQFYLFLQLLWFNIIYLFVLISDCFFNYFGIKINHLGKLLSHINIKSSSTINLEYIV